MKERKRERENERKRETEKERKRERERERERERARENKGGISRVVRRASVAWSWLPRMPHVPLVFPGQPRPPWDKPAESSPN